MKKNKTNDDDGKKTNGRSFAFNLAINVILVHRFMKNTTKKTTGTQTHKAEHRKNKTKQNKTKTSYLYHNL